MISRNKFLSFLIGCTIANSCFADNILYPGGFQQNIGVIGNPFPPIITIQNTACEKDYYVAYCGTTAISLENILNILQMQHAVYLDNGCWPVNGSLTTAQHYQNMRAIFGIHECDDETDSCNSITEKIKKMDGNYDDDIGSAYYCNKNTSGTPGGKDNPSALNDWMNTVHTGCLTAAQNDNVICQKCPNDGKTDSASTYNLNSWKTFNTIADCYTITASDTKGTYTIISTDEDDRCYYSY